MLVWMDLVAWDNTLPAMRGPCFYNAWPNSLQMEMLALGVWDVCYLLLSLWFWSCHYGRNPGQHCGLSCQPHWLPCYARRYYCLCSTGFISFNKRRWKYSTWSICLSFFLYFLFACFLFWHNLKLKKTDLWNKYILFFLNHLRLSADKMPHLPLYISTCVFSLKKFF